MQAAQCPSEVRHDLPLESQTERTLEITDHLSSLSLFMDKKTGAQRGEETGLRRHSWQAASQDFEIRAVGCS